MGVVGKRDDVAPRVITGIIMSDGTFFNRSMVQGLLGDDEFIPRDHMSFDDDVRCYEMAKAILKNYPKWHEHALFAVGAVGIIGGTVARDNGEKSMGGIFYSVGGVSLLLGVGFTRQRVNAIKALTSKCLQKNPYYRPHWKDLMRETLANYRPITVPSGVLNSAAVVGVLAFLGKLAVTMVNPVTALFSSTVLDPSQLEQSDGSI